MVTRYPSIGDEFVTLRETMDRFFGDSTFLPSWIASGNGHPRIALPLDVYATADEVVIIAAAPGLGPDDLDISVNQNTVSLTGSIPNVAASEEATGSTWYLHELAHGSFQRTITLPIEIDAQRADATFENGILRLTLPKAEAAKPRQIKIRVGGGVTPLPVTADQTPGESTE